MPGQPPATAPNPTAVLQHYRHPKPRGSLPSRAWVSSTNPTHSAANTARARHRSHAAGKASTLSCLTPTAPQRGLAGKGSPPI